MGYAVSASDQRGAYNWRYDYQCNKYAVHRAEPSCNPAGARDGRHANERIGYINQRGLERVEAERLDHQIGKVLGSSIGDLAQKRNTPNHPRLRVLQAFERLIPLPDCILGAAHAGDDDSISSPLALFRRQEPGLGDLVRHQEEQKEAHEESQDAQDGEHPAPRVEVVVDMADAIGEKRCDDATNGISREPNACPNWDLISGIWNIWSQ